MKSTVVAFNPNVAHDQFLLDNGLSKTVYALVNDYGRAAKALLFGDGMSGERAAYLAMFEEPWTKKQDASHREFFDLWATWSAPVIDFSRKNFPFAYPTAGASEALRHLIFDLKARDEYGGIHIFKGEYEGYKAMALAAGLRVEEHDRDDWRTACERESGSYVLEGDLFFISQPSAIDGNVWEHFNEFVECMPKNSIVVDLTYVGAVPEKAVPVRFNINAPSIRNVVFSLSKPFGVYYDRIGGVFSREEDQGLFGNIWFKNLTSLALGKLLLKKLPVFKLAEEFAPEQNLFVNVASMKLGIQMKASDVFILAHAVADSADDGGLINYLRRADTIRVCLSPGMDAALKERARVERLRNDA